MRLVLGPSLGTSLAACWGPVLPLLGPGLEVLGFELPGHGGDRAPGGPGTSIADLAARVLSATEGPFLYAGDSIGGQLGLQLLLDAPDRVLGAVLCCTGARIGTPQSWAERREQVEASGTAGLVEATAARWFAPGFAERHPERASTLLHALRDTPAPAYLALCDALAAFDVSDRLDEIAAPVVAVAGALDQTCPPALLSQIADGVRDGRLVVLDDVAHQAPAEAPEVVAALIGKLAAEVG